MHRAKLREKLTARCGKIKFVKILASVVSCLYRVYNGVSNILRTEKDFQKKICFKKKVDKKGLSKMEHIIFQGP